MSTKAKFIYFVLALIVAFTGLGAAALTAVHADDMATWNEVETAGYASGPLTPPTHIIAGDCETGSGITCP